MSTNDWPVLRSYDSDHLDRISLPLGGIGTGTIGLGGRGDLRDFELGNRPGKGFRPGTAFFAVRAQVGDAAPQALVAEGPLPLSSYEGAFGSPAANHGLPRFARSTFDVAYPLGQVHLADDNFPVEVTLQGFNPFVLADTERSSLPVVVLRHRLINRTDQPVKASVALTLSNFIGANGTDDDTGGNLNTYRTTGAARDGLTGVTMTAPELDPLAEAAGELTLAVVRRVGETVSHRLGWADYSWGNSMLDFWDDLLGDGVLEPRTSTAARPVASVVKAVEIAPGGTAEVTFLVTWNFPNRRAWRSEEYGGINLGEYANEIVGNAYSATHPDSWQTAVGVAARLDELEQATVDTIRAVVEVDCPTEVVEAALSNLSTLRSPTVFQTADGRYYGWEGVGDRAGSCFGTCTHVWGYEFATTLLFAEISQSFRRTQYLLCTDDQGLMSFRAGLPVNRSQSWEIAAADGQMACLVHLYLDWRLSGNDALLAELWPAARRTMEFSWIPGGWDADRDGVMEGVQHNTMDVEYYGPNPQMGSWYLAALRACAEMATARGENEFAAQCTTLADSGSRWIDAHLFNGHYYRHEVRGVDSVDDIAPGLRHRSMGSADTRDPDLQLGDGCLVDQLVGEYAARLVGLGGVLDPSHVRTTLASIHERNFLRDFGHHFNHMRSFVLGGESAVLMCTYDDDKRPARPFPYFNEVMTGFEYTAATGLLQTGSTEAGLEIIRAIRHRYDGAKRNPFDEAECGHHYGRAMAAWSAYATLNATAYDGRSRTLRVPADRRALWTTGSAFGTWTPGAGPAAGTLRVVQGTVRIDQLIVGDQAHPAPRPSFDPASPWRVDLDVADA